MSIEPVTPKKPVRPRQPIAAPKETPKNEAKAVTKKSLDVNYWRQPRVWFGSIFILILIGFEYWFISNGFRSVDHKGWGWPISILVPMTGIVTFLGVLFIANLYSKTPDLSNGEMRKAITAGILATYIFFIITILFSNASPIYRLQTVTEAETATAEASPQSNNGLYLVKSLQETPPPPTEEAAQDEPSDPINATEVPAITGANSTEDEIDSPLELAANITKAFTSLVGIVIGFYFGSRSFDTYSEKLLLAKYPDLAKIIKKEEE